MFSYSYENVKIIHLLLKVNPCVSLVVILLFILILGAEESVIMPRTKYRFRFPTALQEENVDDPQVELKDGKILQVQIERLRHIGQHLR